MLCDKGSVPMHCALALLLLCFSPEASAAPEFVVLGSEICTSEPFDSSPVDGLEECIALASGSGCSHFTFSQCEEAESCQLFSDCATRSQSTEDCAVTFEFSAPSHMRALHGHPAPPHLELVEPRHGAFFDLRACVACLDKHALRAVVASSSHSVPQDAIVSVTYNPLYNSLHKMTFFLCPGVVHDAADCAHAASAAAEVVEISFHVGGGLWNISASLHAPNTLAVLATTAQVQVYVGYDPTDAPWSRAALRTSQLWSPSAHLPDADYPRGTRVFLWNPLLIWSQEVAWTVAARRCSAHCDLRLSMNFYTPAQDVDVWVIWMDVLHPGLPPLPKLPHQLWVGVREENYEFRPRTELEDALEPHLDVRRFALIRCEAIPLLRPAPGSTPEQGERTQLCRDGGRNACLRPAAHMAARGCRSSRRSTRSRTCS